MAQDFYHQLYHPKDHLRIWMIFNEIIILDKFHRSVGFVVTSTYRWSLTVLWVSSWRTAFSQATSLSQDATVIGASPEARQLRRKPKRKHQRRRQRRMERKRKGRKTRNRRIRKTRKKRNQRRQTEGTGLTRRWGPSRFFQGKGIEFPWREPPSSLTPLVSEIIFLRHWQDTKKRKEETPEEKENREKLEAEAKAKKQRITKAKKARLQSWQKLYKCTILRSNIAIDDVSPYSWPSHIFQSLSLARWLTKLPTSARMPTLWRASGLAC